MSCLKLAALLCALLATSALAEPPRFAAKPLPDGVPDRAADRNACFLEGEKDLIAAAIDRDRIDVTGCATGVVAPRRTLTTTPVYATGPGQHGDTFDCGKVRQNEAGSGYLDRFLSELVEITERAGDDADSRAALCAANMLFAWAKRDAMGAIGEDGSVNQAKSERSWTLGAISAAYLKSPGSRARAARMKAGDAGSKHALILNWFRSLSHEVLLYVQERRERDLDDTNIQYWNGYAVLPTAILTEDPTLYRSSRDIFDDAVARILDVGRPEDDGFLLRELGRGSRAQSYHAFALKPILGMAVLSKANGCDFLATDWQARQIEHLATKTFAGYLDPAMFSSAIPRLTDNPPSAQRVVNPGGLGYLIAQLDPGIQRNMARNLQPMLARGGEDGRAATIRAAIDDGSNGAERLDLKLGGTQGALVESVLRMQGSCPFQPPPD